MSKYFVLFSAVLMLLVGIAPSSFAKPAKCNISKEEAGNILKELIPNIKIIDVRKAPIDALCEVTLEVQGKKGILYIDSSKKKLLMGSIVDIATRVDHTRQRLTDINRVDVSQIPIDNALILGKEEAKYKVIVFDDPD